ncbi:MAG: radical SAM protein [Planctomycetes bacterium]|nr:radical SAM protein [Planctomycetota bacterium]
MTFVHTPFPQQVVVEVTAACDQQCVFCGRTYMDRPKKTMRPDLFRRIVEEIGRESPQTEVWPTFMGEALLLGDRLFEWIRYARERGCSKLTLNSNGNRLTQHTIDLLVDSGIDRFILSCDGHTKATYEKIRVGGKFEKLYGGAELLLETMRRRGLRRPIVEMQFSVFDENQHEVEDFKRHWLARGVVVKVRPKVYWSGTVSGGEHRVRLDASRTPCLWAMDTCAIHANGNVVMCAIDCEGKYVAGNVETQSVQEIWNGPLRWIRELHMRERFRDLPEICRRCTDWAVKKAQAFFPSKESRSEYEAYVRRGRVLMAGDTVAPQDQAEHFTPDGEVARSEKG